MLQILGLEGGSKGPGLDMVFRDWGFECELRRQMGAFWFEEDGEGQDDRKGNRRSLRDDKEKGRPLRLGMMGPVGDETG